MINAVILLNDDLDNVNDCNSYKTCKSSHMAKSQSNMFFLLSVSIPRPLFPIAGYPLIYHHLRSLSKIEQVQNVFLVGKYDPKKFTYFIDEILSQFSFKSVQYIHDDVPKNEIGVLFKYRDNFLLDNPEHLFLMRYKICSSFPLADIIQFHREKERRMDQYQYSMRDSKKFTEDPQNKNLALITAVSVDQEHNTGKNFSCFAMNKDTNEMLHYCENSSNKYSNLINCGIYFISVRFYTEFGVACSLVEDQDHTMSQGQLDNDENSNYAGCSTPKDHQNSTISGSDFIKNYAQITNPQNLQAADQKSQQFQDSFTYLNSMESSLTVKELFMALCGKKKAYIYEIDKSKDFIQEIIRHEDKLSCQNMYFLHYSKACPQMLQGPNEYVKIQTIGICFIHPTAEIHPGALIGPNVSVGAYAKIHEGCRVINSIILEDAEIQSNSVVINSMVGWNAKIGPWCRIEGTLFSDEKSKQLQGQKFDVSVLGVGVVVDPEVMLRNCLVMPFINIKQNNTDRILF
ncbi:adp-glucose pyrophosphorylase family protein [Stylonychia lemnae]|uniref:Adp-glucose pyrophosphorylase family protein n=1 Tax=Stylonychia lemnae TaxID=5949 RepID=A0A077ZVK3_STYLE|nr:adp-glucose pyrophosphorylase family protein [Stylonychia lemnae]|eukprot:CDW73894.1 adp-glucose pyrophosphorylase family protein [Stylonychia lemnae]